MQLIKSLAAVSLFSAAVVGNVAVASEDQYPAYNFQPSVLFSDPALIEKTSGSVSAAPAVSHAEAAPAVQTAAFEPVEDPKYPAAYFKPSVLYPAN
jgi:hypothetical protein